MKKPIIGITMYAVNEDNQFYLPAEYLESVKRAGGLPVLLAPINSDIDEQIDLIDALIITGGGDLNPKLYGGKTHHNNYKMNDERDAFELALLKKALEKQMPVFAICRGMQVLNVLKGGSLCADLEGEGLCEIEHRTKDAKPLIHDVKAGDDSILASIIGQTKFPVMSWHHQAITDLGSGLIVTAKSEDEVIEAIEIPGYENVIAVQWHPELSAETDLLQQKLFNEFVRFSSLRGAK